MQQIKKPPSFENHLGELLLWRDNGLVPIWRVALASKRVRHATGYSVSGVIIQLISLFVLYICCCYFYWFICIRSICCKYMKSIVKYCDILEYILLSIRNRASVCCIVLAHYIQLQIQMNKLLQKHLFHIDSQNTGYGINA